MGSTDVHNFMPIKKRLNGLSSIKVDFAGTNSCANDGTLSPRQKRVRRTSRRLATMMRKHEIRSSHLPKAVMLEVFGFLVGDKSLVSSAASVCKSWNEIVDTPSLWVAALKRRGCGTNDSGSEPLFMDNFKNLGLKNKGTEGKCFKCYERSSGKMLAMKKARVYPDGEGVPYYMLRELAFLSSASHSHICNLQRVHLHESSLHVFFEYVDLTLHDLINPTKQVNAGKALQPRQVKHFMWQLLSAVAHCHARGVLHRNLKPKHILVKKKPDGQYKFMISDFALVRLTSVPLKTFTAEVVTLWYRAPEVLMGGEYVTGVDVWSAACVFVEMLQGSPVFIGISEIDQLFQIFSKLGSPSKDVWPEITNRPNYSFKFPNWPARKYENIFPDFPPDALDLLSQMFVFDPKKRISARKALDHPYFSDIPDDVRREALEPLAPAQVSPEMDYGYFLKSVEREMYPLSPFLGGENGQPDLNMSHRRMLVDWLIEVVDVYTMSPRSAFIAVGLVDRVLAAYPKSFPRSDFQLLGATCLHVASKCEDVSYIGVEDLASCGDNIYTVKDVLKMEEDILKLLNFKLIIPTSLDFLNLMFIEAGKKTSEESSSHRMGVDRSKEVLGTRLSHWAHYLAELALQEYHFARLTPSEVAAAVMVYAKFLSGTRGAALWTLESVGDDLRGFFPYDRQHLRPHIEYLHEVHVNASVSSLDAVRKRYSLRDHSSVSTVNAPEDLRAINFRATA